MCFERYGIELSDLFDLLRQTRAGTEKSYLGPPRDSKLCITDVTTGYKRYDGIDQICRDTPV